MLFFEFEGWGDVGVDDLVEVGACVGFVFSSSQPNVAGQNVLRRAVGQAGKEKLLLPVIRQAPEEELISSLVVTLVVWGNKEIAYRDVVRVGDVEEIFPCIKFNEFRESLLMPVANEGFKL